MADSFKAKDISIRAQKKLLSKMSNKNVAKTLIDDTSASILDNTYTLAKNYTGSKKEAEKLVKYIIKIIVKLAILARNDQFTKEDVKVADQIRVKFSTIIKTIISFYEVDFTFDKNFLTNNLNECRNLLKKLVSPHLTEKSIGKIDHVLDFFSNGPFLEEMFKSGSPYRPQMQAIIEDMTKAVEKGDF